MPANSRLRRKNGTHKQVQFPITKLEEQEKEKENKTTAISPGLLVQKPQVKKRGNKEREYWGYSGCKDPQI